MTTEKQISEIIRILKKGSNKYKVPIVTEVSANSPYQVLVSCILSLRTTDAITDIATRKLFALAKTPEKMAKLDIKKIRQAIHSVNYYKTKAKRIKQISEEIVKKYNGKVPADFYELLKFKGVGRKTANIVVVYGFGKEGLPIDTHCHRIPNRLGWIKTKTPEQTEKELRKILPKRHWNAFNDIFVRFGQNICRPINPKCDVCPVRLHCKYARKR